MTKRRTRSSKAAAPSAEPQTVASVEELAAMSKLGKVSLREGETAFEDAMHQVAGRLQSAANHY